MISSIDASLAALQIDVQIVRFWLAIANLAWLVPVAVLSLLAPEWIKPRFPQAGLAIPVSGVFLGLAGFSATVAFGFEPAGSWRTILSLLISASLSLFLVMGGMRWLGYDV